MDNIFEPAVAESLVSRIEALTPESTARWGKMNVGQMLAHCNVPFDTVYDAEYRRQNPPPNAFVRAILRLIAKPVVVSERPYKRNMRTAPSFIITDERDFEREKDRLIGYIRRVQADGATAYDGKASHSFGPLTAQEWSTLFYKHTDHHLTQFGV